MEILKDSNIDGQKLEIDYPSTWSYKIIATNKKTIDEAVKEIVGERKHSLVSSKSSKGGKYVSMTLDLIVNDEADRNNIFATLKKDNDIKMVI